MTHNTVWRLAKQPAIESAVLNSRSIADLVKRYIAGPDVQSALAIAKRQNGFGLTTVLAHVGSNDPDLSEINNHIATYCELIEAIGDSAQENELAILPALFGMGHGLATARPAVSKIVRLATEAGVNVTIDMGPIDQVSSTIELFRELLPENPTLGLAVQTRLRRTQQDVQELAGLGARIRLCSGAYPVQDRTGYRNRQDADLAFVRALRVLMESPSYPMVATHDKRLIPIADELADRTGRSAQEYEFQLLYGFRPIEQRRLADTGHRSRVYLPFGREWYDYITRRAAARPFTWARSLWAKR